MRGLTSVGISLKNLKSNKSMWVRGSVAMLITMRWQVSHTWSWICGVHCVQTVKRASEVKPERASPTFETGVLVVQLKKWMSFKNFDKNCVFDKVFLSTSTPSRILESSYYIVLSTHILAIVQTLSLDDELLFCLNISILCSATLFVFVIY